MNSKYKVLIIIVVVIVGICIIALLSSSLKKLQSYEAGVDYDTVGRKLGGKVRSEGLYALVPGSEILIFPNVFKPLSFKSLSCLNYDGAMVNLDVTYQVRPKRDKIVEIILTYKDYESYLEILRYAGEAEIQKACSMFDTFDIIAKRADFANVTKSKLTVKYEKLGCEISGLQVDNIGRPSSYNNALREKEASRENIVVKENERNKLMIQATTKLEKAKAEAEIALQTAETDARVVIFRAQAEAAKITKQYEVEASIYAKLMDAGFKGKSLISYLEVDMISSAQQPVFIGLEAPVNNTEN